MADKIELQADAEGFAFLAASHLPGLESAYFNRESMAVELITGTGIFSCRIAPPGIAKGLFAAWKRAREAAAGESAGALGNKILRDIMRGALILHAHGEAAELASIYTDAISDRFLRRKPIGFVVEVLENILLCATERLDAQAREAVLSHLDRFEGKSPSPEARKAAHATYYKIQAGERLTSGMLSSLENDIAANAVKLRQLAMEGKCSPLPLPKRIDGRQRRGGKTKPNGQPEKLPAN
ncbi:MAG: hypothetical protein WC717_04680 [Candidatus Micrarchaeia archaeon]|jgi:hypothetical protein